VFNLSNFPLQEYHEAKRGKKIPVVFSGRQWKELHPQLIFPDITALDLSDNSLTLLPFEVYLF
jgi:hypothetical protein